MKRVPLGPPLAGHPAQWARLTAADLAAARALWRRQAPPAYRALLDAPAAQAPPARLMEVPDGQAEETRS